MDGVPPAPPLGVRAIPGPLGNQITVHWHGNSEGDLQSYTIWRKEAGSFVARGTATADATEWTDTGLTVGDTYEYVLTANDSHANSSVLSASSLTKPKTATPGAPVILSHQATLGWGGGSAYLQFGGEGGSAVAYGAFKIYRKQEGLPDDQWELIHTEPVGHPVDENGVE